MSLAYQQLMVSISVLTLWSRAAFAQGLPVPLREAMDADIQAALDSALAPGLAVGLVIGDSLVYAEGFGVADRRTQRPVTAETLFQIGSMTKTFTATMLAKLLDQGVIDLDDPI